MPDRIPANLPARSFDQTAAFYGALGFEVTFRDEGWMILRRGELEIEFFPHPKLDPWTSWFSACVRVADVGHLHGEWSAARLLPRASPASLPPVDEPHGVRIFALVDQNESLLPCIAQAHPLVD